MNNSFTLLQQTTLSRSPSKECHLFSQAKRFKETPTAKLTFLEVAAPCILTRHKASNDQFRPASSPDSLDSNPPMKGCPRPTLITLKNDLNPVKKRDISSVTPNGKHCMRKREQDLGLENTRVLTPSPNFPTQCARLDPSNTHKG